MPNNKENQQYIFGLVINRYVLMLLGLLVFLVILWYFSDIVTFVLLAWVFSMTGKPVNDFLRKVKIGKFQFGPTFSAILTILGFFVGVALFISIFVPLFAKQAQNIAAVDYQAIAKALEEPLNQINQLAEDYHLKIGDRTPTEQVEDTLKNYFNPAVITTWLGSIVGLAGNAIIGVFSITFITFFFLKESQLFTRTLQNLTPSTANDKISHVVTDSSKMLTRYFSGIIIQVFIITLGLFIGLSILGVPNALLIAFLAALFNVVPYIGPIIGGSIGIFLTITSSLDLEFYSQMLPLLGKVAIVFAVMQMVDNFILQPFIFSNRVHAHPLEIFIIVLVGAKLGGVIGMVIAIPFYTVFRIIAKNFLSEFDVIKNLTKNLDQSENKA